MLYRWFSRFDGPGRTPWVLGLALSVVAGVEAIVAGMDWLLLRQVTWDYLLTGLVASGVAAPSSLWVLHRVQAEVLRLHADHSQQELQLANARLRQAQQGGGMVFWELDVASQRLVFDPAVLPLIGLPPASPQPDLSAWLQRTHPDDQAEFSQRAQAVLAGTAAHFDCVYRLMGLKDDWVWVHTRGEVTRRDAQGRALWVAGGTVNMDAQKRAQLALEAQRHLLQALLDALPLPVFYKDAQGRYLGLNAAFARFYGVSSEQLVGRSVFDLNPSDLAAIYHAKDQALFDHPGQQIYESQVRNLDGSLREVEFHKATFNDAQGQVAGLVGAVLDLTERKAAAALIWRQANFDTLTGLPNRHMWQDRLAQSLLQSARRPSKLALMYIDLDHFKEVNDTLGHAMGDELLCQAAQRMGQAVRESDTLARLGDDEFALILGAIDDLSVVERVGAQIREALSQPFALGSQQGWVSASVGVAFYPDDASEAEALCRCADRALYRAKALGRNRLCFSTPDMQVQAAERARLRADLPGALERGEFWLAYQPIVALADGRLRKAEALLRWQHPTRGLLRPEAFIALAEETGQIHALGDWVLQQALRQLQAWTPVLGGDLQVCINKSSLQLQARPNNIPGPAQLHDCQVLAQRCVIELSEAALALDSPALNQELQAFRAAGVHLALHDLGLGHVAPAQLSRLGVTFLQLDSSYVQGLAHDPRQCQITRAVIDMAHTMGLQVVALGVETAAQREMLRAWGCDAAQGFLWAPPMRAEAFTAWALARRAAQPAPA